MDKLELRARIQRCGCGIYEAGSDDRCYVRLFVTDSGYVLPVNHRVIGEEDLMEVYTQGVIDGRGGSPPPDDAGYAAQQVAEAAPKRCTTCDGEGRIWIDETHGRDCPACHGSGAA